MPTQRWKQLAVFWPSRRCIFTLLIRSSVDWCRWVKRLTVRPVRLDFTVISSAYCGSWASAYVMATQLMLGRIIGWSTQFSIFSPNIYTRVFSSRRLSIYSFALFIAIFLPPKPKIF